MHPSTLPRGWRVLTPAKPLPLLNRVLTARGYTELGDQAVFLAPDFARDTYDPWLLPDCEVAVNRLLTARDRGETVAIYGDYDADGLPAAALVWRALRHLGFKSLIGHIPSREEGHGLSAPVLSRLRAAGASLLLTVDTGSNEATAITTAAASGLETIITDHHELTTTDTAALAHVNPKRPDSRYPNPHLCGAGVAYRLLWALYDKVGKHHTFLKWQLDLAALATVADLVPLVGENRALVYYGLQVLRRSTNRGLQALARVAGVELASLTEHQVAFHLAPRLNAPSRLGRENGSAASTPFNSLIFDLLTTDDPALALELAVLVNQYNQERQAQVRQWVATVKQAVGQVPTGGLVYYLPAAPLGLIGLIASQLAEENGWPALIMAGQGATIRGSGRSPTSLDLVDLLAGQAERLIKFGGHRQAAGWSVASDQLEELTARLQAALKSAATEHPAAATVEADTWLDPAEATLAGAEELARLAPFGRGNPAPLLLVAGQVAAARALGATGQHCRLTLKSGYPDLIWFNAQPVPTGADVIAAVNLSTNIYQGVARPQLTVRSLFIHA